MSAKIYYLPGFKREPPDAAEPEAPLETEAVPKPKPSKSGTARFARNPMPGGRGSKWKRRLDGKAVRREE